MDEEIALLGSFFEQLGAAPRGVVVALSGGRDSLSLLLLLKRWTDRSFPLVACHVDHGLRPESSVNADHVARICADLGVPLEMIRVEVPSETVKEVGVEAAARDARYAALYRFADDQGGYLIATGHHRRDQAETLMIRLLQKGSPMTLRGISRVSSDGRVIRPLLDLSPDRLRDLARESGYSPVEDPMNADPRFLRSRVRHQIRPSLPQPTDELLARLAGSFGTLELHVRSIVDPLLDQVQIRDGCATFDSAIIPDDPLLSYECLAGIIRRLGSGGRDVSIARVGQLVSIPSVPRTSIGAGLMLAVDSGLVRIERSEPRAVKDFDLPLNPGQSVPVPGGFLAGVRFLSEPAPQLGDHDGLTQTIGLDPGIVPEFRVRTRRPGDRFHPLGSRGEKKLGKFLIDRKVPREIRNEMPLFEVDRRICWIPGVEVSEPFRVSEGRTLLELSLRKPDEPRRPGVSG